MTESWASSDGVRKSMKANRSRDTGPELRLRSELHRRGLRYFVDRAPIKGVRRRADVVFPRRKIAVFVDGCFWHGCPEHHTVSKTNADYWKSKVERNRIRDRETDEILRAAGWTVLRSWEHEDASAVADRVEAVVRDL
ncbi:MAG: very short patch repair endonuclease [Gordonia sp. (in: high G+C Gram-positive bacteria)]